MITAEPKQVLPTVRHLRHHCWEWCVVGTRDGKPIGRVFAPNKEAARIEAAAVASGDRRAVSPDEILVRYAGTEIESVTLSEEGDQ